MKIWLLVFFGFLTLIFLPDIERGLEVFFSSPPRYFIAILLGGIFYIGMIYKNDKNEFPRPIRIFLWGSNALFFILWGLAYFLFEKAEPIDAFIHCCLFVIGILALALLERSYIPFMEKILSLFTKKAGTEREHLTDVRDIAKETETQDKSPSFDPKKYFKEGKFFLGMAQNGDPVYWDGDLPHCQVVGTSGAGKGRFIGVTVAQCAVAKQPIFIFDPKDDEFGPAQAKKAADDAGIPYFFLDLGKRKPQISCLAGCDKDQLEELLIASFELGEKGGDSDHYRHAEREMAELISQLYKESDTPYSLFKAHGKLMEKSVGFRSKFRDLARTPSINAKKGLSLEEVVKNGGIVYIVGSMRNTRIIRIQKMLLVRLIQLAESRDRISSTPKKILIVLDELKYHISKTALEALGAARDKGLHLLMAHQSLGDLRDCPSDLKPETVIDAVFENAPLKVVYRVQSPETAEFFARKSGMILVDVESRKVDKTLGLAQKVTERKITQEQSYLYDENQILYLPKGVGIVFGQGLPQKVSIAPIQVKKSYEAITVKDFEEDESLDQTVNAEIILEG